MEVIKPESSVVKTYLPELIKNQLSSYKIIIPKEVEAKIRCLCNSIHDIEWSGVLFYSVEGTFEKGDLTIICKDIYLMDVGTAGFTEFDVTPEVAGYIAENIELINYHMGLVHSHNTMSTFFSKTDTDTLQSEGNDRNHFVSLIVNNAGVYSAAITRRLTYTTSRPTYKSFDNKEIKLKGDTELVEKIEYFTLNVTIEEDSQDSLKERINEVKSRKKPTTIYTGGNYVNPRQGNCYGDDDDWYNYNNKYYPPSNPINVGAASTGSNDKSTNPSGIPINKEIKQDSTYIIPTTSEVDKVAENALKELVTGSIAASESKIDLLKWVNTTMVPLMDKRFGRDDAGLKSFEDWCGSFVEFILWNFTENSTIFCSEELDDDIMLLAKAIIKKINTLKSNKYLTIIKDTLDGYTSYQYK